LKVWDDSAQTLFNIGHEVGAVAQRQFPNGVLVESQDDLSKAIKETTRLMNQKPDVPIYEATFSHGGVLVRTDILLKMNKGYRLIEVKASTSLKDYYINDVAVQAWVIEQAGYPLKRVELAHINNQFVYQGNSDYNGLFVFEDVSEQIKERMKHVPEWVSTFMGMLKGDIPSIEVQEHLDKAKKVKKLGIKVLSLFFIDKVANYRSYDDMGNPVKGKIALWFEEELTKLLADPRYKDVIPHTMESVHDGYFAQDKKGILKDSSEGRETQADEDVYNKIMRNKEQLLSMDEPLQFLFSHSALREGWDNPNVFQICTLNETKSEMKKRQEIGRGLRLPVNQDGERVFDDSINKLTVIANESYEDFARKLQSEIEEDFGIRFGRIEKNAFAKLVQVVDGQEQPIGGKASEKIWRELENKGYLNENGDIQTAFNPEDKKFSLDISTEYDSLKSNIVDTMQSYLFKNRLVNRSNRRKLKLNKQVFLDPEFERLWNKIKHKTTYSVEYQTDELVKSAVKAIKAMDKIEPLRIFVRKDGIEIKKSGVQTTQLKGSFEEVDRPFVYPDVLAYLQKQTELTRGTLVRILKESGKLGEFLVNPQKFMTSVAVIINRELNRIVEDGIKYEKIAGQEYEMRRFEEEGEVIRYLDRLLDVQHSIYDAIEWDSDVEKQFARELDSREDIKLFVKLPGWFKVETPVGPYNPDWAIVKKGDKTVYLIRETKGTKDFDKLRTSEAYKIKCGKKHFDALGVDFKTVVKASEV